MDKSLDEILKDNQPVCTIQWREANNILIYYVLVWHSEEA